MSARDRRADYVHALRRKPVPPAVVTDLQRLDARLSDAAYRLKQANEELHRAEVAHREAGEAVDAELARLQSDRGDKP
jgi:hypothetical protein